MEPMTGKQAILYVIENYGITSKKALADSLSGDGLTVQPIQISNYLDGTKMSQKVAERFLFVYGINVSDAHRPSDFAETVKAIMMGSEE